jgi:ribonuclease BN (tRNA processing enzyme)
MHADHHLGLPTIILRRSELVAEARKTASDAAAAAPSLAPLLVVGPFRLYPWLSKLFATCPDQPVSFQFVANSVLSRPRHLLEPHLADRLGLGLNAVGVQHSADAYGLVATAAAGAWRFVYSGDTRPCAALEEAGRGATLLVHEATFEDALAEDAVEKSHATVSEALGAARRMGAARLIITHFSQRYPGVPPLPDGVDLGDTAVAFDLLRVSFSDLDALPRSLHALKFAFAEEDEDGVAAAARGGGGAVPAAPTQAAAAFVSSAMK